MYELLLMVSLAIRMGTPAIINNPDFEGILNTLKLGGFADLDNGSWYLTPAGDTRLSVALAVFKQVAKKEDTNVQGVVTPA